MHSTGPAVQADLDTGGPCGYTTDGMPDGRCMYYVTQQSKVTALLGDAVLHHCRLQATSS